jgi:hypothetical protein
MHDPGENQSYIDYSLWGTNVINIVWSIVHFVNGDTALDIKQFMPLLQEAVTAISNDGALLAVSSANMNHFKATYILLLYAKALSVLMLCASLCIS